MNTTTTNNTIPVGVEVKLENKSLIMLGVVLVIAAIAIFTVRNLFKTA